MPQASLLQDVLRQQLEAVEDAQRKSFEDSDDETIDVVSNLSCATTWIQLTSCRHLALQLQSVLLYIKNEL